MQSEMTLVGIVVGKKAPQKKGDLGEVKIFSDGSQIPKSLWFFQDDEKSMSLFHQFPEPGGNVAVRCGFKFMVDTKRQGVEKISLQAKEVNLLSGMSVTTPSMPDVSGVFGASDGSLEITDSSSSETSTGLTRGRSRRGAKAA